MTTAPTKVSYSGPLLYCCTPPSLGPPRRFPNRNPGSLGSMMRCTVKRGRAQTRANSYLTEQYQHSMARARADVPSLLFRLAERSLRAHLARQVPERQPDRLVPVSVFILWPVSVPGVFCGVRRQGAPRGLRTPLSDSSADRCSRHPNSPEAAHPYYVFRDAGYKVTFASPKGGKAPLDPASVEMFKEDKQSQEFLNSKETMDLVNNTHKVRRAHYLSLNLLHQAAGELSIPSTGGFNASFPTVQLSEQKISDYDALFYAGGHGPVFGAFQMLYRSPRTLQTDLNLARQT